MIRRLALIAITGAAAIALVSALAAPASTTATKLDAVTGPDYTTISVKRGGKRVRTLKPGKYTITVSDRSDVHNFRLRGPRLNKMITTLPFTGRKTVTVTLKKGRYAYVCDPHEFAGMKGEFRVR